MEMIDQILWSEFRKGSKEAFQSLFREFYSPLYFYGVKFCNDKELTEEVLQDFFIYLYNKSNSLSPVKHIKSYLLVSFRRMLLKRLEQKRGHLKKITNLENCSSFCFNSDELEDFQTFSSVKSTDLALMLNKLPERQKEVVYLKFYNNLKISEIAEVMEISTQSVSNTLQKAFSKLRNLIENDKILSIFK
ncbi:MULTISPECIES: RNA polymerase sigma factor [Flavobacteriaceae]|uniref:RNA polymerase sigma factor n=1 Tax=Flavobacteriaceae TaxID=49546 RepID=UPI0010AE5957|nr:MULTISPECIES: sigma-70 family RNA polymerase sigma factor [Flavobacteriaceae]NJB35551.1 sigma-70 family RNA polymerase sigma factor [Croceivirga sp. JEA036]TKD66145.1 sigma-70 family RNA polymerase sigma factor [Flavobacterium sp. ASW18X]